MVQQGIKYRYWEGIWKALGRRRRNEREKNLKRHLRDLAHSIFAIFHLNPVFNPAPPFQPRAHQSTPIKWKWLKLCWSDEWSDERHVRDCFLFTAATLRRGYMSTPLPRLQMPFYKMGFATWWQQEKKNTKYHPVSASIMSCSSHGIIFQAESVTITEKWKVREDMFISS